jgi:hypothetical protein
VRIVLDAHLSSRAIASTLRALNHDVVAADEDPVISSLSDPDLLRLAAYEDRILVTCNIQDFPDILRDWAEEGRDHAGCIMLVGIDHSRFGLILQLLENAFRRLPSHDSWRNCPMFLSTGEGRSGA